MVCAIGGTGCKGACAISCSCGGTVGLMELEWTIKIAATPKIAIPAMSSHGLFIAYFSRIQAVSGLPEDRTIGSLPLKTQNHKNAASFT
jgi:hypothetical protein